MDNAINWDAIFRFFIRAINAKTFVASPAENELLHWLHRNMSRLSELRSPDDFENGYATVEYSGLFHASAQLFFYLLRDGGRGSKDAVDTCRKIFRTMYPQEYNWLKRMHVLRLDDILDYVGLDVFKYLEEPLGIDEGMDIGRTLLPILCMSKILGIPLDSSVSWDELSAVFSAEYKAEGKTATKYLRKRDNTLRRLEEAFIEPSDDSRYWMMLEVGSKVRSIYDALEIANRGEDLIRITTEDINDPFLAAVTYLDMCGYRGSPELIPAIAGYIDYIATQYHESLLSRIFLTRWLAINDDASQTTSNSAIPLVDKKLASSVLEKNMQQVEKLRDENLELRKKLSVEKGRNMTFHQELDELRKQTDEHSAKNEELKKQSEDRDKELEALRRLLLAADEERKPSIPDEEIIAFLSSQKACVIGGHPNWLNKIRSLLPGWKYIGAAGLQNKDASFLAGLDCIFIFTDHLDHKTYSKVMQVVRPTGVPIGYITSVNVRLSLEQFYASFFPDD